MNMHTEPVHGTDPLEETWSEQEMAEAMSETPTFGHSTKQRRTLMGVVVLGGVAAVLGMRLLVGGPATVQADAALDGAIDGFIQVDAQRDRASLADSASLARLLETGSKDWQVPLSQLQRNPFRGPAEVSDAMSGLDGIQRAGSTQALKRLLDTMEVTMVLRGQFTVAMIDGMRMLVGHAVETDEGFEARLLSVGSTAVEVELIDPGSGGRVRGLLPIGPRDRP